VNLLSEKEKRGGDTLDLSTKEGKKNVVGLGSLQKEVSRVFINSPRYILLGEREAGSRAPSERGEGKEKADDPGVGRVGNQVGSSKGYEASRAAEGERRRSFGGGEEGGSWCRRLVEAI